MEDILGRGGVDGTEVWLDTWPRMEVGGEDIYHQAEVSSGD